MFDFSFPLIKSIIFQDANEWKLKQDQILKANIRRNQTIQPFVLLIGADSLHIAASYVVVNKILYKMETPLDAFDVCFKSFFALRASYPKQCEPVWIFIQQVLYEIFPPTDSSFQSVNELVALLNANKLDI